MGSQIALDQRTSRQSFKQDTNLFLQISLRNDIQPETAEARPVSPQQPLQLINRSFHCSSTVRRFIWRSRKVFDIDVLQTDHSRNKRVPALRLHLGVVATARHQNNPSTAHLTRRLPNQARHFKKALDRQVQVSENVSKMRIAPAVANYDFGLELLS